ncbi:MAG: MoxR family ATPase, partial [Bacillota bacterium]
KARHAPFVFLTSNATRELSEALKRRCLYLYLDFPSPLVEESILQLKVPDLKQSLARQLTESLQDIRKLELKKKPSIAESIDWALALVTMGVTELDRQVIIQTLNVLLKYQEDIDLAKARIPGPAPRVSPAVQ